MKKKLKKKIKSVARVTWLALSEKGETLDLSVLTSSPTLGVEMLGMLSTLQVIILKLGGFFFPPTWNKIPAKQQIRKNKCY